MEKCSSGARSRVPGVRGWEAGQATRAETRYGCFLPDLTGLARRPSTANLPTELYQVSPGRWQPPIGGAPSQAGHAPRQAFAEVRQRAGALDQDDEAKERDARSTRGLDQGLAAQP